MQKSEPRFTKPDRRGGSGSPGPRKPMIAAPLASAAAAKSSHLVEIRPSPPRSNALVLNVADRQKVSYVLRRACIPPPAGQRSAARRRRHRRGHRRPSGRGRTAGRNRAKRCLGAPFGGRAGRRSPMGREDMRPDGDEENLASDSAFRSSRRRGCPRSRRGRPQKRELGRRPCRASLTRGSRKRIALIRCFASFGLISRVRARPGARSMSSPSRRRAASPRFRRRLAPRSVREADPSQA
jgi:hypothetical protein